MHVAQLLYEIHPIINISDFEEYAFRYAIEDNYIDVVQWSLEIKPTINISANYDHAFKLSCYYANLIAANWFCILNPFKYNVEINNNKITKSTIFYKTKYNILCLLFCIKFKGFYVSSI